MKWITIIISTLLVCQLTSCVDQETSNAKTTNVSNRDKRNFEYGITHAYPQNARLERRISNVPLSSNGLRMYPAFFPSGTKPYTYYRHKPQLPPYAVQMEPLTLYSQRDPLYDPSTLLLPQPHNELTKPDDQAADTNHLSESYYGVPKTKYIERPVYIKEPEPIIEIIIKEANSTTPPAQPIVSLPPKKKKEEVQVFYVKYKKNPHGTGKDSVIYDKPIPALTPIQDEQHSDDEHGGYGGTSGDYIAPTYAPPPSTTIRAIIKPDSETYHADTGIHVTFGGASHNPHAEKYSATHDDDIADSAPQPAVSHPDNARRLPTSTYTHSQQEYKPEQRIPQPYKPFNFNGNTNTNFNYNQRPPSSTHIQGPPAFTNHHQSFNAQPSLSSGSFSSQHIFNTPVANLFPSGSNSRPTFTPQLKQQSSPPFALNKPYQFERPQPLHFPKPHTHFPIQQQPPLSQTPINFLHKPPVSFQSFPPRQEFSAFPPPQQQHSLNVNNRGPPLQHQHQSHQQGHPQQVLHQNSNSFSFQTNFAEPGRFNQNSEPQYTFPRYQPVPTQPPQPTQSHQPAQHHQPQHHQVQQVQHQHQEFVQQHQQFNPQPHINHQPNNNKQHTSTTFNHQQFSNHQQQQQQQPQQQLQQHHITNHQTHQQTLQQPILQNQNQFVHNQVNQNQIQHHQQNQILQNHNQQHQHQHFIPPGGELIASLPKYEQHISIPSSPDGGLNSQNVTAQTHDFREFSQLPPNTAPQNNHNYHISPSNHNEQSSIPQNNYQQTFNQFSTNYKHSGISPSQNIYVTSPKPVSTYSTTQRTTTTTTTTTTPKPPSTTTNLKDLNIQLPDEVPDDLREQLLSSGILKNAQISVLDYDKVGDIPLSALPPDQLANFYSAGGAQQIAASSDLKPTIVKADGSPVEDDMEEPVASASDVSATIAEPPPVASKPVEMKVVHYDPHTENGKEVQSTYVKDDAMQVEPVVLNDQSYNRYLPLKVSGAKFPIPDVPELKGKNINSVVVLAPVDYNFYNQRVTRDAKLEDDIQLIKNEALKKLVKEPTRENYERFLDNENKTKSAQQAVILLVTGSDDSNREIFMYDVGTKTVSKLDGELSAAFVDAAESNTSEEEETEKKSGEVYVTPSAHASNMVETKVPAPEGIDVSQLRATEPINYELDSEASSIYETKVPIIDPMQADLETEASEQLEQFVDFSSAHNDLIPAASNEKQILINSGYSKTELQMPSN